MRSRVSPATVALLLTGLSAPFSAGAANLAASDNNNQPHARAAAAAAADAEGAQLEHRFSQSIHPFVENYCVTCHSGSDPDGHFDISTFNSVELVVRDHDRWAAIRDKLVAEEMPPDDAKQIPSDEERAAVISWIEALRRHEAERNAGDPGIVLARRLSNAEYNHTVRDLTGVDIRPAREFPVDPANPAGFDNSGESLAMSPALLNKYFQAAREVANHAVLKPTGIAFAPHPMLVETDRDKYCINQIIDFYNRQATDYADYFQAAWQYKHRAALGRPAATLADIAAQRKVSGKYLATVWRALEETKEDVGPGAKLQGMWRALPAPRSASDAGVRPGCEQMRDFVTQLRAKLEPRFANLTGVRGISGTSQPFLMWKNRQYATHRMSYDRSALQVGGQVQADHTPVQQAAASVAQADAVDEDALPMDAPKRDQGDPDLVVPAGERERYEAAFARFCAVFPDAFYVSERGRNYLDKSKDRGRLLSAGFHNVMGYFRDDQPLYELVLDEAGQRELDGLWREFEFIAAHTVRTYVQFYFNESGEARDPSKRAGDTVTTEPMIQRLAANYVERAKASANPVAIKAVEDHFAIVNADIRWFEQAHAESETRHLAALHDFARRAYRRPLTEGERADIDAHYRSLRADAGLTHEDAMRDSIVGILMYPDFCYRIDLVDPGEGVQPLSDHALASRLSYFLWASMPDEALLARAAAGELRKPEVLAAEAKRMLQDPRVRGLATEFGGAWLGFQRFDELNTVDRERFPTFDNDLRAAMGEEPVQFMLEVFRANRPVLDFLFADYTFVNAALARHYGMTGVEPAAGEWVRVDRAGQFGRGGLLPMAAFLTKNAPGQRTSPVKRGYWVVKQVLGEHIPPPPAVVPELPRDEAKMELSLRETLARHREDRSCASCHARFDSLGLVFEGYGPVGERRTKDLAGRPVDASADFPRDAGEGEGVEGLRKYVRDHRQQDFVENLSRKLLAYALGRSLMLSDEPLIEQMCADLEKNDYRFDRLIESIVTSTQFRMKRSPSAADRNT